MHPLARYLDPRRSLFSAISWIIVAVTTVLVLVASVWVDQIVSTNLLDARGRQLDRAASHFAADLNRDLTLRLRSVRALAAQLATELGDDNRVTTRRIIEELQQASPEFEWIGVANPEGRLVAATHGVFEGASVAHQSWFALGLKASGIGDAQLASLTGKTPSAAIDGGPGSLVDLIASVIDARGERVGVVGARLNRRWLRDIPGRLRQVPLEASGTEAILLDQNGTVLFGPSGLEGRRWGKAFGPASTAAPAVAGKVPPSSVQSTLHIARLADGSRYLIAQATPSVSGTLHALGWRVVALQSIEDSTKNVRFLQGHIALILLGLGLLAMVLGVLLTRRVTRDLNGLARSVDAVRLGTLQQIPVSSGQNEAAQLGRALDALLTSQRRDRDALQKLNSELEQRVTARTREIERLAEEARYAAVIRERLKIARDLHDTLAHSMMAMLTQIRLLKQIWATNPEAMVEELKHAEETAHQGMKETRAAITHMRFNPVRDAGLTAALDELVKLFVERTGIPVDYTSNAPAGTFANERAETLFRIAEEAMRNVERHAAATRVTISLRITEDGHGLTLTVADNGIGLDVNALHPGHYGLTGLREQTQMIGATLKIDSASQQGTTISVTLAPTLV